MAQNKQPACSSCGKGLCGGRGLLTLKDGAWTNNPLAIQVLGICSALKWQVKGFTALGLDGST